MDLGNILTRVAACLYLFLSATVTLADSWPQEYTPLPLEVVAAQRSFTWNAAFDLSRDGKWLAYTFGAGDEYIVSAGNRSGYSATGVPMSSAQLTDLPRRRIAVKELEQNRTFDIGAPNSWSWAPSWAPDGSRLAYFSDEDGGAALWLWQRDKRERIPDLIVRPISLSDLPRWSRDGRLILCRVLPEGVSIAQANAPPAIAPGSAPRAAAAPFPINVLRSTGDAAPPIEPMNRDRGARNLDADLAIIDVQTRRIQRIVKRANLRWYSFSPDQKYIAYAQTSASARSGGTPGYDMFVYDLAAQTAKAVGSDLPLSYVETSWTWSPDSSRIGGFMSQPGSPGRVSAAIIAIADGTLRRLDMSEATITNYNQPLLWHWNSRSVYVIAYPPGESVQLWQIDARSGRATAIAKTPGDNVNSVVRSKDANVPWSNDGGRTIWVLTRQHVESKFFRVAVDSRRATFAFTVNNGFNDMIGASTAGRIVYIDMNVRQPPDIWSFDVASGRRSQLTRINEAFDSYALGDSQLIEWQGPDGRTLHGAVLLPPGYRPGRRLPLLVWTFGWEADSDFVDSFGFAASGQSTAHNLHALTTRGYAVLFPDVSLHTGTQMKDTLATVMPGVDLLIERGYVDPDRLAVSGFSLGSYTVLALITQTKRFKAAIISGASIHPDLIAEYVTDGLANQSVESRVHGRRLSMGVMPWQDRDVYVNNSPLFFLDRTETPLLIGQGSSDDLLPAYVLHSVMRDLRKELELRIYPGEGHEIAQKQHVLDFWQRRIEFLDDKLDIARDAEGRILFDQTRAQSRASVRSYASSADGR